VEGGRGSAAKLGLEEIKTDRRDTAVLRRVWGEGERKTGGRRRDRGGANGTRPASTPRGDAGRRGTAAGWTRGNGVAAEAASAGTAAAGQAIPNGRLRWADECHQKIGGGACVTLLSHIRNTPGNQSVDWLAGAGGGPDQWCESLQSCMFLVFSELAPSTSIPVRHDIVTIYDSFLHLSNAGLGGERRACERIEREK